MQANISAIKSQRIRTRAMARVQTCSSLFAFLICIPDSSRRLRNSEVSKALFLYFPIRKDIVDKWQESEPIYFGINVLRYYCLHSASKWRFLFDACQLSILIGRAAGLKGASDWQIPSQPNQTKTYPVLKFLTGSRHPTPPQIFVEFVLNLLYWGKVGQRRVILLTPLFSD